MKNSFQEILEPEPLFVFMMQYCSNKTEAMKAAQIIVDKLKSRGKKTYSRIFENVDLLKKYAESL